MGGCLNRSATAGIEPSNKNTEKIPEQHEEAKHSEKPKENTEAKHEEHHKKHEEHHEKPKEIHVEAKHDEKPVEKHEDAPKDHHDHKKQAPDHSKEHEEKKPSQAGGHEGSLMARGDKLLKRVGPAEYTFYTTLFAEDNADPDLLELRKFVPQYFGIEKIDGRDFLVLENLLTGYDHPSILDCKIGKVTWTKDHNERKTADQMKKAAETTTGSLGFRISGMVVKDENGTVVESFAKEEGFFNINADNIHEFFRKIVGDNNEKQIKKFIKQTKKIIHWFKTQRSKLFFTASVFYVYGKNQKSQTRFIDFAHVYDAEGQTDESN